MKQWISGIAAASVLSAMAMALTPKGSVRQVTRLCCGLLCALAVAAPILRLDYQALGASIALYKQQADAITSQAEEEGKMLERTYIQDKCRTYILSKAARLGAPVDEVTVAARWDDGDGVWYPWTVSVEGAYHAGLAAAIEGELGVPAERQMWHADR